MSTRSLLHYKGPDKIEASIELHQRFALPVACLMLALVGIPLGVGTRKGGKSGAYVTAVFLGFFGYWLSTVALVNMAKQKSLSPQVASWLPDLAFGLLGVVLLSRMERPGDSDFLSAVTRAFDWFLKLFKPRAEQAKTPEKPRLSGWRIPLLPQIVDTYILTNFLFYLGMVLAAFVSMILMFNFFELTGDMIRHNISMLTMGKYLFFLTPMLVYDTMPICILVAVLVNLAVLSKNNEITAFKACGVSLYRMAAPILIVSTVLSAGLFALDFYYLPAANRTQDRLRDVIKARPPQTYYRPDRTWKMGKGFRIYYYSAFDQGMMVDANVFELQPATFQVVKQIRAARARWNPSKKEWIFEDGWYSEFTGRLDRNGVPFETQAFPELKEDPTYFLKENLLTSQMNFVQLQKYIEDLDQSGYGYDTVKLRVHLFQKYSVPLFATIMAMIAIPFGFLVGRRGAMTGVGFSIGVALAYWGISKLFENIGELNQLPPSVAAWAPDVVFAFLGLYFLLRMKS